MLNDLPDSKDASVIKVRVIRKWINHIIDKPENIISLDVILIDEQGNMAHGSMRPNLMSRFDRYISQDKCYHISNVSIGDYPLKYRYVNNSKKINIFYRSVIKECDDFGGDTFGFRFQDIESLSNCETPSNTIVDLIGYVPSFSPIKEMVKTNNIKTNMMNLKIRGLTRKEDKDLSITLWGTYATQLSDYMLAHPENPPLFIVLQFALFRTREGRPSASNSNNVSKLFINEDIAHINQFKDRYFQLITPSPSSSGTLSGPVVRIPMRDEFLSTSEFKQILEIEEIREPHQFIICAKILPIPKRMQWYYVSCKVCHKAVKERVSNEGAIDGQPTISQFKVKYYCHGKCNGDQVDAVPRYRINFSVQDSTGIQDVCLWEGLANRVLNIGAADLLEKVLNLPLEKEQFPEELAKLENRIFAFKLAKNDYNVRNPDSPINISKMTDDSYIVAELQNRHNMNQQLQDYDDSVNVDGSQVTTAVKVGLSSTDDNINVMENSTGKSTFVDKVKDDSVFRTPSTKRNLIEVYDVDNPTSESATKSSINATGSQVNDGKFKLKIPKLEK